VEITYLETDDVARSGPFDLVLCDVPCSGSGAWRRSPEGKWKLTGESLLELGQTQAGILNVAAGLTAPSGVLAYATCSLLDVENSDQIAEFLRTHPEWCAEWQNAWPVQNGTDGFFSAHLTRDIVEG
jgi:16S rRNA (cytosine967-C5)-methyltransferase